MTLSSLDLVKQVNFSIFRSRQGQHVALIEQSSKMYGTCINIGCIPSKTLVHDGIEGASFDEAFSRKMK